MYILPVHGLTHFGGGDGILNFNDFVFSDGSQDYTLTIVNWDGDREQGGDNDQIIFGTTLSRAQLSRINFNPTRSLQFPTGEGVPVPVPEPAPYFCGCALLAFFAWRERHRFFRRIGWGI